MKKYVQLWCFGIEMLEIMILSVNEEICLKKILFLKCAIILAPKYNITHLPILSFRGQPTCPRRVTADHGHQPKQEKLR